MTKLHTTGRSLGDPILERAEALFRQINPGREKKLQDFLRNNTSSEEEVTRIIREYDIIFPYDITEISEISYTDEQLQQLADALPTEEQLRWLKDNNYALVAGPSTKMSLLDICSAKSSLFYYKKEGWYANQSFAANDKVGCRWLAIRRNEVPNSLNKNWDAQKSLLQKCEEVPNATEMSWFIATYYEVRGVQLFSDVCIRTSSAIRTSSVVLLSSAHIVVGKFNGDGLRFYSYWDDDNRFHLGLGVSASWKFPSILLRTS